jgi:hypothetical protein
MAAPAAVKTQVSAMLDAAWDAYQAGTLLTREWQYEAVKLTVGGQQILFQVDVTGLPGAERFHLTVKRL